MQTVPSLPPLLPPDSNGLGALYDSLISALLQPVEPARRHVIVASTKGFDTVSSVDAAAVRAVSERSDALLHLVALEQAMDNDAQAAGFQCGLLGFCWPTRRSWIPVQRRLIGPAPEHRVLADGMILRDAAQLTGGHLHRTTVGGVPTLSGTFRRAFDDFRSGYVLRYTPEGVDRGGWHAIQVRVPRNRSYTVRGRNGYGIDETAPPATPPPLPEELTTLADLIAAYDRAAFQPVVVGLRQVPDPARLIRDFEDAGNPWPAAPRREAAFAIELAESAVYSARSATRREAYDLLARFTRLVRHPLGPDQCERYWPFAALTQLEGAIRPDATEPFVERALDRFPDEPRFHLSRAVVRDQRWAGDRIVGDDVVDASGAPTAGHIAAVRSAYTAAMAFPETAVEARVRLAWFLHRTDQHDEALALLNEAGSLPNAEPAMQYLRHLFAGRVLEALARHDDAAAAYRAALTVWPAAQSARVALMNTVLQQGAREPAEVLAGQVQAETDERLDPFWVYWQAQYRLYPAVMARLREMSR
jgi:tetratricopeptide (TPR) repeat protein